MRGIDKQAWAWFHAWSGLTIVESDLQLESGSNQLLWSQCTRLKCPLTEMSPGDIRLGRIVPLWDEMSPDNAMAQKQWFIPNFDKHITTHFLKASHIEFKNNRCIHVHSWQRWVVFPTAYPVLWFSYYYIEWTECIQRRIMAFMSKVWAAHVLQFVVVRPVPFAQPCDSGKYAE